MIEKINIYTIFKFIIVGILALILIVGIIILFSNVKPGQNLVWDDETIISRNLDSEWYAAKYDSLKTAFGGNTKALLAGYELQCLIALSQYPELKEVNISFEFAKISAPLESNFDFTTLHKNAKNRKYRILISDDSTSFFKDVLFDKMNFDTQIALLTHELGHTVYYHQLNLFQIGRWGLNYLLSDEFQQKHESDTDRMVIYKGLGWQQFESAAFFTRFFNDGKIDIDLNSTEVDNGNYLSPTGVLKEMQNIAAYEPSLEFFLKELENKE